MSAFGEIRLDAALECVAGVEHEHAAAVGGARRAQVVDEASEDDEPAASCFVREQSPVQVVRADDGQRYLAAGSCRAARGGEHGRRAA